MIHNKVVHKCLLKAFYRKTNKKEYKLQILEHNIRHINVIHVKHHINS